jgi:nicotinamide-nucleotide adenylyltransferase
MELVIGSAGESRTEKNPLTGREREEIIRECFPDIEILRLEDEERNEEGNRRWAEKLEEKISAEILLTRNELVKDLIEAYTDLQVEEQDMYDEDLYSGTEVRRRIRSGEEWRYLVPECSKKRVEELTEIVKKTGQQYEFEPGWKRENAYHGTAED